MENTLKKMEKRIRELESKVATLEALLIKKIGVSERDMEIKRMVEEMRRDPEAWRRKCGMRAYKPRKKRSD